MSCRKLATNFIYYFKGIGIGQGCYTACPAGEIFWPWHYAGLKVIHSHPPPAGQIQPTTWGKTLGGNDQKVLLFEALGLKR
jgi:hypothetical protein